MPKETDEINELHKSIENLQGEIKTSNRERNLSLILALKRAKDTTKTTVRKVKDSEPANVLKENVKQGFFAGLIGLVTGGFIALKNSITSMIDIIHDEPKYKELTTTSAKFIFTSLKFFGFETDTINSVSAFVNNLSSYITDSKNYISFLLKNIGIMTRDVRYKLHLTSSKVEDTFVEYLQDIETNKRTLDDDMITTLNKLATNLKNNNTGVYNDAVEYYSSTKVTRYVTTISNKNTHRKRIENIQKNIKGINKSNNILYSKINNKKFDKNGYDFNKLIESNKANVKELELQLIEEKKLLDAEMLNSDKLDDVSNMKFTSIGMNEEYTQMKDSDYDSNSVIKGTTTVSGGVKALLETISKHEGGGGLKAYNRLVYSKKGRNAPKYANLTSMTLSQVLAYQDGMLARGHASTAVGKYQFMKQTLKETIAQLGLPMSTIFSVSTQDKLGEQLLNVTGLKKFREGKMSISTFEHRIAGRFASIKSIKTGKGRYDGDSANNRATVPASVIIGLLKGIRSEKQKVVVHAKQVPSKPNNNTHRKG